MYSIIFGIAAVVIILLWGFFNGWLEDLWYSSRLLSILAPLALICIFGCLGDDKISEYLTQKAELSEFTVVKEKEQIDMDITGLFYTSESDKYSVLGQDGEMYSMNKDLTVIKKDVKQGEEYVEILELDTDKCFEKPERMIIHISKEPYNGNYS